MILYRRSHIDARRAGIDGDSHYEYFRIKIFTEEGAKEQSNVEIRYWKEDSEIKDIRARTIHPDGSIVNFDGKVYEKTAERTGENVNLAKSFSLPDVQPGSIVEYMYRQDFKPNFLFSENWIVSGRMYMRDASFSIAPYVPRSNFDPTLFFRTTRLPQGLMPQRKADGSYVMEVHDIAGIEEEPLMPPMRSLQARVEFFYREKGEPGGETTAQFWGRMGKRWSDELDKFLNKKSVLDSDLAQTVASGDAPETKLQKIYARAQKIRDLTYEPVTTKVEKKQENIKTNENVEDVLKRGYASGRQINWLFIGLARAAGFEAFEVYLVPRNHDVFIPSGQNTDSLTADIVWVRANGKEYWLDPAATYYPFGLLPWYETESKGVRVAKQGAEFVTTPAANSSNSTIVRRADLELKADGSATGKLSVDLTGQSAAIRRTRNRRDDEAGRQKSIEKEIRNWLPAGSTFETSRIADWEDTSKPVHVEGTLEVQVLGSAAAHRMIVPEALFAPSFAKSFEAEQRVNPVHFEFRFEHIDDIKIHAPAGFKIETVPPKQVINTGAALSYEIASEQQGDSVEVKRHFVLGDIDYPRESYGPLRSFFGLVRTDDEAKVVLESSQTAKNN